MKQMLEFKAPLAVEAFNEYLAENEDVTIVGDPTIVAGSAGCVERILVFVEAD